MSAGAVGLATSRYGKDKVRVFRIVRGDGWHDVVEYEVRALVEGDFDTRYRSLAPFLLFLFRSVLIF